MVLGAGLAVPQPGLLRSHKLVRVLLSYQLQVQDPANPRLAHTPGVAQAPTAAPAIAAMAPR